MTQAIDPLGRETDYTYDATCLDLLQVKQKRGGTFDVLESRTYNSQHEPLTITDAAGQTTTLTYNVAGQVLTVTNAKSETTTMTGRASTEAASLGGETLALRVEKWAKAAALILLTSVIAACSVESDFTLSRDSRLPSWFNLGSEHLPNDAVIQLVEYSDGSARMILYQPGRVGEIGVRGTKQAEVRGEISWHPATLRKQNKYGGFDPDSYPHYRVMRVDGTFEILEFKKMEPLFYITDNPELRATVNGAPQR